MLRIANHFETAKSGVSGPNRRTAFCHGGRFRRGLPPDFHGVFVYPVPTVLEPQPAAIEKIGLPYIKLTFFPIRGRLVAPFLFPAPAAQAIFLVQRDNTFMVGVR